GEREPAEDQKQADRRPDRSDRGEARHDRRDRQYRDDPVSETTIYELARQWNGDRRIRTAHVILRRLADGPPLRRSPAQVDRTSGRFPSVPALTREPVLPPTRRSLVYF